MGNTPRILLDGHGIALSDVDRVGPSIAYWTAKYNILEIDWTPFADVNLKGNTERFAGLCCKLPFLLIGTTVEYVTRR